MFTLTSFIRNCAARAGLLAALGLAATQAGAVPVVYTDAAAYRAALSATFVDSFGDLAPGTYLAGPLARSAGGMAYEAIGIDLATPSYGAGQGAEALFTLDNGQGSSWLSANFTTSALRFGQFGPAVHGVGGYFFGTNFDGAVVPGALAFTVTDADGSFDYPLAGAAPGSFLGFISNSLIGSLTVTTAQGGPALFTTAGSLEIGIIPEPGSAALIGVAGLALALARRRRGAPAAS